MEWLSETPCHHWQIWTVQTNQSFWCDWFSPGVGVSGAQSHWTLSTRTGVVCQHRSGGLLFLGEQIDNSNSFNDEHQEEPSSPHPLLHRAWEPGLVPCTIVGSELPFVHSRFHQMPLLFRKNLSTRSAGVRRGLFSMEAIWKSFSPAKQSWWSRRL